MNMEPRSLVGEVFFSPFRDSIESKSPPPARDCTGTGPVLAWIQSLHGSSLCLGRITADRYSRVLRVLSIQLPWKKL